MILTRVMDGAPLGALRVRDAMSRAQLAVALAIALVLGVAQVPAHHHPDLPPAPWTSSRPHSKSKHQPRDRRARKIFHWPSPCYLDTAPVIFPGPGAVLRPPFGDTKEPPFKVR
jgi:hypothetical protein